MVVRDLEISGFADPGTRVQSKQKIGKLNKTPEIMPKGLRFSHDLL